MEEMLTEQRVAPPQEHDQGLRAVRAEGERRFSSMSRRVQGDAIEKAKRMLLDEVKHERSRGVVRARGCASA